MDHQNHLNPFVPYLSRNNYHLVCPIQKTEALNVPFFLFILFLKQTYYVVQSEVEQSVILPVRAYSLKFFDIDDYGICLIHLR